MVVASLLLQNIVLYGDGEQSEEEDDGLVKKTSLSMFASMRNPAGLQKFASQHTVLFCKKIVDSND